MKKIYSSISSIAFVLQTATSLFAQVGPVASGGDATGSGGSMSFSIGQMDYNAGTGSGGSMNLGLQQPIESFPLPITLMSFTAQVNSQNKVDVKWSTATEINNAFFMVQRSKDAALFEDVVKVKGAGNSSSILNYQATDEFPYTGKSYYRLKQSDFDGHSEYSKVVAVQINNIVGQQTQLMIYPNPTTDFLTLSVQNTVSTKNMSCAVYDMWGKLMMQQKLSGAITTISLTDMANATYFIKVLENGDVLTTFKVMKIK